MEPRRLRVPCPHFQSFGAGQVFADLAIAPHTLLWRRLVLSELIYHLQLADMNRVVPWRRMCADKPDFSIARLFARGHPHKGGAFADRHRRAASGLHVGRDGSAGTVHQELT